MLRTTFDSRSKTWIGPKNLPLYSNRASLGLVAYHSLGINPNKVLQICADDDSGLTGSEIRTGFLRVALNLRDKFHIQKGDVIGIVAMNTKYLAALVFGSFTIGAPINPLDPSLSTEEMAHLYKLTRPRIVFCDRVAKDRVRNALPSGVPIIIIDEDHRKGPENSIGTVLESHPEENDFIPPDLGDTDTLLGAILSSSGSTGPPKAVALTQTILKYFATYSDFNVSSSDVRLCFSTLHWYSGVITLLASIVKASPRIITRRPFYPAWAVEVVQRFNVNYIVFPARQLTLLNEYLRENPVDLPSISLVDLGGSLANVQHIREIKKFIPNGTIGNFYGMTEMFGLVVRKLDVSEKYCAGTLLMHGEVQIQDAEDGTKMGINERGEILIKPWFPLLGYYNNGEYNRDFLTDEGFIRSGDIGYFDDEGDLHIVDRIKETFKYNNFQVSPSEIESVLQKIPGVLMAQVVGVPAQCGINSLATAFIVRGKGGHEVTEEIVADSVRAHFSEPKWLHGGIYFLDAFPVTASGKVSKRLLREWLLERKS